MNDKNCNHKFFGSKLNTVLLLILIILTCVMVWFIKTGRVNSAFYTRSMKIGPVEFDPIEQEKATKGEISNTYTVGQVYSFTTNDRTWKAIFIGYEDEGYTSKKLPAFNLTDDRGQTSKVWSTYELVLYPNTTTSVTKVESLTKSLGAQITRRPGQVYNQVESDYYVIMLPKDKNIFDAISFYKKNESFSFVEPSWVMTSSLNN